MQVLNDDWANHKRDRIFGWANHKRDSIFDVIWCVWRQSQTQPNLALFRRGSKMSGVQFGAVYLVMGPTQLEPQWKNPTESRTANIEGTLWGRTEMGLGKRVTAYLLARLSAKFVSPKLLHNGRNFFKWYLMPLVWKRLLISPFSDYILTSKHCSSKQSRKRVPPTPSHPLEHPLPPHHCSWFFTLWEDYKAMPTLPAFSDSQNFKTYQRQPFGEHEVLLYDTLHVSCNHTRIFLDV